MQDTVGSEAQPLTSTVAAVSVGIASGVLVPEPHDGPRQRLGRCTLCRRSTKALLSTHRPGTETAPAMTASGWFEVGTKNALFLPYAQVRGLTRRN